MTPEEARRWAAEQGIALESARGGLPSLAEEVVGETMEGGWWGHPRGSEIFSATRAVRADSEVLTCRLVDGKVTYVHRRLWPALVRLSHRLDRSRLAALREVHTKEGRHRLEVAPFPEWVSSPVHQEAGEMSEQEAVDLLSPWLRELV